MPLFVCDPDTGAVREVYPVTSTKECAVAEHIPLDNQTMIVRVRLPAPLGRVLLVAGDLDCVPTTLIAPRGVLTDNDPAGALRLRDGRVITWGPSTDYALRLWTNDGVPIGILGSGNRFQVRDAFEDTLLGEPT